MLWSAAGTAPSSESHGHAPWFFFVFASIIVLGALVQVVRPDLGWRMSRWQYRNKQALEPSPAGLLAARLSGAVVVIAGIVIIVVAANR